MGTLNIILLIVFFWFLGIIIRDNIIHPEVGQKERTKIKERELKRQQAMLDEDGNVKCPKCGSKQIQIVKRGWKVTTGFINSGKNERVCVACKHKF